MLNKLCLLYCGSPEYLSKQTDSYKKPNITFHGGNKVDLNIVAKMNEFAGFLKLLRKLDKNN